MFDLINILILSFIGSIIALVGVVVFLFSEKLSEKLERNSVPFAAGVLIVTSILGLMPEAVHGIGENAFVVVLIAFVAAYLFEHFSGCQVHHHAHHHGCASHESAIPLVIVGDTIHNFIDGVAIAITYLASPGLGIVTTLSTFLHEVPHEIGDFGILLSAGWEKKKVLIVNILSASVTIIGALMVFYFSKGGPLEGYLLAISAGLFLYLGASDFLPHIEKDENPRKAIYAFMIGVFIMVAALKAIPHSHDAVTNDTSMHPSGEELLIE